MRRENPSLKHIECLLFSVMVYLGVTAKYVHAHSEVMSDFERKSKFTIGIQSLYSDYKDSFSQHIQQYSYTVGRLGFSYKPKTANWNWNINGYSTFGSEYHTPKSFNSAQFRGGDFSFNFPFRWKIFDWRPTFSMGWSYRSMMVTDNSYGVATLSSPMAALSFRTKYSEGHKMYLSLKYTYLLDFSFQNSGSEISGRFAHTLFRKWRERPLYIFGEGTSTKVNIQSERKNATLFLASIGLIQEF